MSLSSIVSFLVNKFSYFGVFVASILTSSVILVPVPSPVVAIGAGVFLNPIAVGVISGFGAALGEATGYALGYSASKKLKKKKNYMKLKKKLKKYENWNFAFVFISALTPLPDDIMGIYLGTIKYPFWKFLLACALGKITLYTSLALGGKAISNVFL